MISHSLSNALGHNPGNYPIKKQKKETVKDNYAQLSAIPATKIRGVGYTEQP
ncbi:hypothetical protein L873DRAFT_1513798 [Choiromyces venosus 120613-1]|uniref:Uncharacterized protein n=1 Tax=Choiromyces venosus 120613-1 TaxID=1336337 RepID=A0A3N4J5I6_9PEZI|nr:hypothetical protein L873DRAFT_1513798 [Choiromyces venosus 120613-1]